MQRILLIMILCLTLDAGPLFAFEAQVDNHDKTKELMTKVMDHFGLPSFSVAIAVGGEINFAAAKGYADVENKIPATADTQYSVGSLAKPMTSIALARLVDAGSIDLDQSVQYYVPELTIDTPFTVKQLASHTSGMGRPFKVRDIIEFENVRDYHSPLELMDLIEAEPLQYAPDTGFQYTSTGYILLSAVVEKAAGINYTDYMQKGVFGPLGMAATVHDTSIAGVGTEAQYYSEKSAENIYIPSRKKRDRSFLFGGGGYISTPTDLVKLANSFFQNDFLTTDIKQKLTTPVRLENGDVNEQAYGLGWRMGPMASASIEGRQLDVIHHGGITDEASTAFLIIIPEHKAAMAFATNMAPPKFWQIRGIMTQDLMNYLPQ